MSIKQILLAIVVIAVLLYELLAALDKRSMETCEMSNTHEYCEKHLRK